MRKQRLGDVPKPVGMMCACQKRDELLRLNLGSDKEIRALRDACWVPCWRCSEALGCHECRPTQPDTCPKCRAFVHAEPFIFEAPRMHPEVFEGYPSGWRLESYAVHGAPSPSWLPSIRSHLRSPARAAVVNRVLRHMGREELPLDLGEGAIVDKRGEEETARAKEILGDVMEGGDKKAFFKRLMDSMGKKEVE